MEDEFIKKLKKVYGRYKFAFNLNLEDKTILAIIITHVKFETNFLNISEKFTYSNNRFKSIFPKYYEELKDILPCKNKKCERLIADKIYNRIGGYMYRGRGYIQLTGKYNYKKVNNYLKNKMLINFNLIKYPDLILDDEVISMLVLLAFWDINNINKNKDIHKSIRIINPYINKVDKSRRVEYFNNIIRGV